MFPTCTAHPWAVSLALALVLRRADIPRGIKIQRTLAYREAVSYYSVRPRESLKERLLKTSICLLADRTIGATLFRSGTTRNGVSTQLECLGRTSITTPLTYLSRRNPRICSCLWVEFQMSKLPKSYSKSMNLPWNWLTNNSGLPLTSKLVTYHKLPKVLSQETTTIKESTVVATRQFLLLW